VILTAACIVSFELREETVENAQRQLSAVSRLTAERTEQTFSAADLLIRSIQDLIAGSSLSDEGALRDRVKTRAFYDDLVNLQKLLPQVQVAAVTDAQGDLFADTRQFPAPELNARQSEVFNVLKADPDRGLAFDRVRLIGLNRQWMLYLARALKDSEGHFAGIAFVGIPIAYFEDYLARVDEGPDTALSLVSSDLTLIARWPRIERAIGMQLPAAPSSMRVGQGTDVAFQYGADGRSRLVASTHFKVNDALFYLAASQTEAALLHPWRTTLAWIGLFVTISLLALGTLTLLGLRAIRDEDNWGAAIREREKRLSKQTRELVLARDAAETANRVRGHFLANMSHELRTPLNAVLGFAEILQKELFGPLGDARYKEFAADIHSSGKHLLDIITNILDLAKVDAGKLELNEEILDLADLMKDCARMIAETAQAAGIVFQVKPPESAVMFRGDCLRLKQIVLNLLSNAVKFTPSGNHVIFSGELTGEGFVLRVADTGIGMSKEESVEAMQAFRQIDSSFSRRHQGTGLGLPLAKSLVDMHGGTLTIDSESGKGTTVMVLLPLERIVPSGLSGPS
jgi:signal transduction histidine kinase